MAWPSSEWEKYLQRSSFARVSLRLRAEEATVVQISGRDHGGGYGVEELIWQATEGTRGEQPRTDLWKDPARK